MIPAVLLLTLIFLALLEIASRRADLRNLYAHFSIDTKLSEPGEIITLRYTVRNNSLFPILYAGLTLRLDTVFSPEENEDFMQKHAVSDFAGTLISHNFYLAPKRQFTGKLRFSIRQRGVYDLGRYYLEFGDFLGLKPRVLSDDIGIRLICTAAPCDTPSIKALGGELGAVSVRRFLYDDPIMVLGYRDYSGREPLKQISWNQSAKTGRMIVRQHDFTTDRAAVVVVNIDPTSRRLMEHCLSLTSSVCKLLEKEQIPYAMLSNGDLQSLTEGLGANHLFFIQRRIGLSRHTGYTGFASVIDDCLRRKKHSCTHIIITPSLDESTQAAINRLARHIDQEPIVLCAEKDIA